MIANARKNALSLFHDGLKVHIIRPALNGKANKELVRFLSACFKVAKNDIMIVKGHKSRRKQVKIAAINKLQVLEKIQNYLQVRDD